MFFLFSSCFSLGVGGGGWLLVLGCWFVVVVVTFTVKKQKSEIKLAAIILKQGQKVQKVQKNVPFY